MTEDQTACFSRSDVLSVRFWGVRGSIPCPGPGTNRYGGNTSCVEVRCDDRIFIFDAGSGLRELGKSLGNQQIEAHIFLSHCHFDHICGLPFFAPIYAPANRITLWAGNLLPRFRLERVVDQMMASPLFPIRNDVFAASLKYQDFRAGTTLQPARDIAVRTIPLNHPDGATGYRLDYAGRSIAYLTDHEADGGEHDDQLAAFLADVDVLILDCTYSQHNSELKAGWGHSTWEQGLALASSAKAKLFCLFHHDPDHDDDRMDRIADEVAALRSNCVVAREGMTLHL